MPFSLLAGRKCLQSSRRIFVCLAAREVIHTCMYGYKSVVQVIDCQCDTIQAPRNPAGAPGFWRRSAMTWGARSIISGNYRAKSRWRHLPGLVPPSHRQTAKQLGSSPVPMTMMINSIHASVTASLVIPSIEWICPPRTTYSAMGWTEVLGTRGLSDRH